VGRLQTLSEGRLDVRLSRGTESGVRLPVVLRGFPWAGNGAAGNTVGGAGTRLDDVLECNLFLYVEYV